MLLKPHTKHYARHDTKSVLLSLPLLKRENRLSGVKNLPKVSHDVNWGHMAPEVLLLNIMLHCITINVDFLSYILINVTYSEFINMTGILL